MEITSFKLRMIAMACMVCDHLWATLVPGNHWLTWVGRLAFPIFAFLTAEGYRHTGDFRRYLRRLVFWAVITELPFDLMYAGIWVYPFHQNVLWTFVLSLLCLRQLDKIQEKRNNWMGWLQSAAVVVAFYLAGQLLMVDYFGYGLLMVVVFHYFRGNHWRARLLQLLCLYVINWHMMGGLMVPVSVGNLVFEIPQQGMAVLALLPIWLYRGRQGYHSTRLQIGCYAFYPVHMLILGLLSGMM